MKVSGIFFLLQLFCFFCSGSAEAVVFRSGIDVLDDSDCRELRGKKVALITNAAGLAASGQSNYGILLRNGIALKFLMAPEHGFAVNVEAGKKTGGTITEEGLPVYSLYGSSKKPDVALLKTVDVVLFDLQDIGARCYTYISTMRLAMEACQEAGRPFMVLDRPNPVSPLPASGFMLHKGFESFVGAVEVPFLHAMTVGEIAMLLKKNHFRQLDLRVVRMEGYRRDRFGDELPGFTFTSPSPNIRNIETAMVYPATVFLEATAVSEGRGTEAPFLQFGAPFIDAGELASLLASYRLQGVLFRPVAFIPVSGKYKGERCAGVRIVVTDRRVFDPFRVAVAMLLSLQGRYPQQFALEKGKAFFDRLAGTDRFRQMILQQASIDTITEASRDEVRLFVSANRDVLLYP
ncbi:MAG: DUF1343 domain-containing protein [Chlorobi bacterium]|nr:DUF1343 domain-containing protein [Chlorobiota bacterium]